MPGVSTLIYRSLRLDRSRTLLSVLAVAAAITLVIVLEGFKTGLYEQVRTYREQMPATLVAVPAGARSVAFAQAGITEDAQHALADSVGVERASPLVSAPLIFVHGDQRAPITLVGYDGVGGPWRISKGRGIEGPEEAVLDRALSKRFRVDPGDTIELVGGRFLVVGLSEGTSSMLGSYVFIGLQDAHLAVHAFDQSTEATRETATQVLLDLSPGVDAEEARRAIEKAIPQIQLVTPAELAANDVALTEGIMGSTMDLLVVVSYVVGVLVISLTLYAVVLEHLREFGVLKAIGSSNGLLYRYVLGQAAILSLVGFGIAVLASLGVAWLISVLVPQYQVLPWQSEVIARAAIATGGMALIASLIPVRQVANVEPAVVFRS